MSRWFWSSLLIAVTAIWGWTFAFMKAPAEQYGVVPFLAMRFALAGIVMLPAVVRPAGWTAMREGWPVGMVLACAYLLQTLGLVHTSATNCGLITGLFVIFAPVWNWGLFRVPIPRIIGLAALLSFVGLAMLTGTGVEPLRLGDLATFGAAAAFGLHIALLDRIARHHNAASLAGVQFLLVATLLLVMWPFAAEMRWPSRTIWPALLVTSLLATVFGFYVQTAVQQRLAAARVAVILTMESAFATLFGVWLGSDRLTATQWVGAAIMLAAVLLAEVVPRLSGERSKNA